MAVLVPPIHIRGDALDCMRYIQDPEKIVENNQTANVMRYMQSHCIEDAMSVGYNGCSGVRELAIEQFRAAEEAYKAIHPIRRKQEIKISVEKYYEVNRKGKLAKLKLKAAEKGMSETEYRDLLVKKLPKNIKADADGMITIRKTEVTAEHLVISLHKTDKASPAKLQAVADKFMEHPYLRGFPALSNQHWNTDEKHVHILISNYASDGSRKLSLSGTKVRELRRYLDRICYEHGLSIIDTKEARLDPEHAAWIDQVKAEGIVKVWPENFGSFSRGGRNKQEAWKAAKIKEINLKIEYYDLKKTLSDAAKEDLKDLVRNDIFASDGTYIYSPIFITHIPNEERRTKLSDEELSRRFYFISKFEYDKINHRYRRRSLIELIYCLARVIITGETDFLEKNYPSKAKNLTVDLGKPDWEIQRMLDAVTTARELNIRTPDELYQRRKEIGMAMRSTKEAIKYDETTLSRTALHEAILTWQDKNMPEDARNDAYAVLAAHGCTSPSDQADALERFQRAQKRLPNNQKHMEQLKKDYRNAMRAIKSLEKVQTLVALYNDVAYEASKEPPEKDRHPDLDRTIAETEPRKLSLNDQIASAGQRSTLTTGDKEKEQTR